VSAIPPCASRDSPLAGSGYHRPVPKEPGIVIHPVPPSPEPSRWPGARLGARDLLAQRVYRFRILGMGMAALPMAVVLHERQATVVGWAWLTLTCLLWPHIARALAGRGTGSYPRELRNLLLDSCIAGTWIPLLHFNLLPSVLIATVATADKINSGVRGLWWRSLPGLALGLLVSAWLNGFAFAPHTSMPVVLACLPIMLVHTLAVSLASYGLVRKVQRQNHELDAMSRTDALTGLDNRSHWQQWADRLLRQHRATAQPAMLLMIDVDHFKSINDAHGHIAGDDVLRAVATILRQGGGPGAHIGRFGGDEFAMVLAISRAEALAIAERIRHAVERLQLPQTPELRCSISIGMAEAGAEYVDLRGWIEAADHALYRAKHGGRNRTASDDLRAVG
jgi:diguanylate cyclase